MRRAAAYVAWTFICVLIGFTLGYGLMELVSAMGG